MGELWQKIQRGAAVVGDFQARLILTVLYGLLVLPTGLIARLGGELLESNRRPADSYWRERSTPDATIRNARRQG